jgi:glutamyl/glutaminyl-tRNA synthetase
MFKLAIVSGVVALTGLVYYSGFDAIQSLKASVEPTHATQALLTPEYKPEELAAMSPEQLIQMQKDALASAKAAASDYDELERIEGRPDFVSPAEWMMLQAVASQKANPAAELLRLVNLLRFNKQLEALDRTSDADERKVLIEAVLAQLPKRIKNQEMSVEKAQSIQLKLISQIYSDNNDIRDRAAEEARRIGAEFSIKAS